jgi:hypothetical protein
MAACVQHKGVKFKWAPLIQNTAGKSLPVNQLLSVLGGKFSNNRNLSRVMAKTPDFVHLDTKIDDNTLVYLKPYITSTTLATRRGSYLKRAINLITNKNLDVHNVKNTTNFIITTDSHFDNSLFKNDRRFRVLRTTQDSVSSQRLQGFAPWLLEDGVIDHILDYLREYNIPDDLNPACTGYKEVNNGSS